MFSGLYIGALTACMSTLRLGVLENTLIDGSAYSPVSIGVQPFERED